MDYMFIFLSRTVNGVPIYEEPPSKYYAFRIMQILLDPKIDVDRIAKQRPLQTHCSSTFVVDITQLSHLDDIKKVYMESGYTRALTLMYFDVHLMMMTVCV